jgi:hypothetical protein
MTYLQRLQGLDGEISVCPPSSLTWQQLQKIGMLLSKVCYHGIVLKK